VTISTDIVLPWILVLGSLRGSGAAADPRDDHIRTELMTIMMALTEKQAKAFEGGVPTARVIRLRGAHYIFLSNERDVLREMRAFLAGLK
jgi:hypothetical protein